MPTKTPAIQQPVVIPIFFATEMWERFGFYMIQALLVLYMTSNVFGFSDAKSYAILGAVSAMAYIMPIFGGYLASRILDYEHAVILGGFLLVVGYALLALHSERLFYIALATMTIGTGFFKPSISCYLGDFYHKEDSGREKGYTIFYIGINVGILLSTISSGYIVRYFGWHTPFLLASIGLVFGTTLFVVWLTHLKKTHRFHRIKPSIASKQPIQIILTYLSIPFQIGLSYCVIQHQDFANELMSWGGLAIFFGLLFYAFKFDKRQRQKLHAALLLTIVSVVYWSLYFQMYFSMNLFTERAINRQFFSWQLPTPLFASMETIFLILIGPFLGMLWQHLSLKNKNPSTPLKFAMAMLITAFTFLLIFLGTKLAHGGMNNMLFLLIAYCLIGLTELLLSPIGLAMVTTLAPAESVGLMMGVWFVSLGLGEKLAGFIAGFAAIPKEIVSLSSMDNIYGHAFLIYAGISLICAIICFIMVPFLNRMIK